MTREGVQRSQMPTAESGSGIDSGLSVFSQFLGARKRNPIAESLSKAMGVQMHFASPQPRKQQQQFFPTVHPTPQVHMQPGQQLFPQQNFGIKMLTVKDMKPPIERFTGKEECRGLRAGFKD